MNKRIEICNCTYCGKFTFHSNLKILRHFRLCAECTKSLEKKKLIIKLSDETFGYDLTQKGETELQEFTIVAICTIDAMPIYKGWINYGIAIGNKNPKCPYCMEEDKKNEMLSYKFGKTKNNISSNDTTTALQLMSKNIKDLFIIKRTIESTPVIYKIIKTNKFFHLTKRNDVIPCHVFNNKLNEECVNKILSEGRPVFDCVPEALEGLGIK